MGATANTTRVGGGDAASTAAGVALAVYPSAQPSQRPGAVTVADAAEWRTAIAAAALTAPPLGAPLLVSEAGGMPDADRRSALRPGPPGRPRDRRRPGLRAQRRRTPDDLRTHRVRARGAAGAAAIAALREG